RRIRDGDAGRPARGGRGRDRRRGPANGRRLGRAAGGDGVVVGVAVVDGDPVEGTDGVGREGAGGGATPGDRIGGGEGEGDGRRPDAGRVVGPERLERDRAVLPDAAGLGPRGGGGGADGGRARGGRGRDRRCGPGNGHRLDGAAGGDGGVVGVAAVD